MPPECARTPASPGPTAIAAVLPEGSDPSAPREPLDPAEVIEVRVREERVRDPPLSLDAKGRLDHRFAGVAALVARSRVDQKGPAAWERDPRRVSLPYVEHHDDGRSGRVRPRRNERHQRADEERG